MIGQQRDVKERVNMRTGMFKCSYCNRWECNCFKENITHGPDDEIIQLKDKLKECLDNPNTEKLKEQ